MSAAAQRIVHPWDDRRDEPPASGRRNLIVRPHRPAIGADHHLEGGLGDAVLEALAVEGARARIAQLAVRNMPTSGTPAELLDQVRITRHAIADTVRALVATGVHATEASGR